MKKKNLLLSFVASLGFALTSIGQIPDNIPTSGLVGWWPFNGNANDESGNGNNGIVSGATTVSDRDGNSNSAYRFDATNIIQIPHASNYNSVELSISLWFTSDNFTSDESLISKRENSGWGTSFELNAAQSNGLNGIGTSWSVGGNNAISHFSQSILTNQWNNFIFIWASDSVKIYLNGNFVEGTTVNGGMNFNTLPITIGSRGNGWNQVLGKIDDIAIWNRALSQNEINILFSACSSNLVLSQPADQNTTIGNNPTFTTTSNDQNANFQWQSDLGLGFQNLTNAGQYSGATTSELIVSSVSTINNNQQFRCIMSSGACSDTTNLATLTVGTTFLDENTINSITISPNPTQDFIFVEGSSINVPFQIIDFKGSVLITTNSNKIDVKKLSPGQYYLKYGDTRSKFIKE